MFPSDSSVNYRCNANMSESHQMLKRGRRTRRTLNSNLEIHLVRTASNKQQILGDV